jgi:hypothetical protein
MSKVRTVTGIENLLTDSPKITLLYRYNSLYEAISGDIIRILMDLGFQVHHLELEARMHSKSIRRAAQAIIGKNAGNALVLPDFTSWSALRAHDEQFAHFQYPFGNLDVLLSDAAIASLFARTSIPPSPQTIDTVIEAHFEAITSLFSMIKEAGFEGTCHVVQSGLAEHAPFVIPLIRKLEEHEVSDEFPPNRENTRINDICGLIEGPLALRVAEAINQANVRTRIHEGNLVAPVNTKDVVVADLHYVKRHPEIVGGTKVIPLPLASLIAQACHHTLLPKRVMEKMLADLELVLRKRYTQLVKNVGKDLPQAK